MAQSFETKAAIRFGYGFRLGETDLRSIDQLLTQVNGPDTAAQTFPTPGYQQRMEAYKTHRKIVNLVKQNGESFRPKLKKTKARVRLLVARDIGTRCTRAVLSNQGFRERLVSFWADHFTVIPKGQEQRLLYGHFFDQAVRPHVGGRFADLLIASTLHPSMLTFLDQNKSVGPNSRGGKRRNRGLNENLAREVLELHTMGVNGSYTQNDVRQLAELLTGLVVTSQGTEFKKTLAEPGAETVLGKSYGGGAANSADILAFLQDLAVHPDTADYIARKLVVHFISDQPDTDLIAHMRDAFLRSGGDLPTVYAAMLEHPGAWENLGGKVKQPFDLIVSGYRALNVAEGAISKHAAHAIRRLFWLPLIAMGQPVLRAPGPNGWPEEAEAWITPQGLAARLQWALVASATFGKDLDPRVFVKDTLREVAGGTLISAVGGSENRTEALALVLSSPEFNRR